MPREITDRDRVVEAVKKLSLTAELFEEQNGKPKYAGDLEVIVRGRVEGKIAGRERVRRLFCRQLPRWRGWRPRSPPNSSTVG